MNKRTSTANKNQFRKGALNLQPQDTSESINDNCSVTQSDTETEASEGSADRSEPKYYEKLCEEGIIDAVEDDGVVVFLISSKESSQPNFAPNISLVEGIAIPPERQHLRWALPKRNQVARYLDLYRRVDRTPLLFKLIAKIEKYLLEYVKLPRAGLEFLLALWAVHTYMIEKFNSTPFLLLHGVPERGKSRLGKALTFISFRGMVMDSFREAHIIRLADYIKPTLFLDVTDLREYTNKGGCADVLLNRFQRGASTVRVNPEAGKFKEMTHYESFGPTIAAVNEMPDDAFVSRCIVLQMPEATHDFESSPSSTFGLPIREELTALRALYFHENFEGTTKPVRGRLGEILLPLKQICLWACPERLREFDGLCLELEKERKGTRSASTEALATQAYITMREQTNSNTVRTAVILDEVNRDFTSSRDQLSIAKLGRCLTSLGFRRSRGGENGNSAYSIDELQLKAIKSKYGLTDGEIHSVPSDPSDDEGESF